MSIGSYVMAVGPRPEVHAAHAISHDTSHDIHWIRCVILMFLRSIAEKVGTTGYYSRSTVY